MKPDLDKDGQIKFVGFRKGGDKSLYGVASTGAWHRIPMRLKLSKKDRLKLRRGLV